MSKDPEFVSDLKKNNYTEVIADHRKWERDSKHFILGEENFCYDFYCNGKN